MVTFLFSSSWPPLFTSSCGRWSLPQLFSCTAAFWVLPSWLIPLNFSLALKKFMWSALWPNSSTLSCGTAVGELLMSLEEGRSEPHVWWSFVSLIGTGADKQWGPGWCVFCGSGSNTRRVEEETCGLAASFVVDWAGEGRRRWTEGGGWGWPTKTLCATVTTSVRSGLGTTVAALGWEGGGDDGCSSESHRPLERVGDNTEPAVESGWGWVSCLLANVSAWRDSSRLLALSSSDKDGASSKAEEPSRLGWVPVSGWLVEYVVFPALCDVPSESSRSLTEGPRLLLAWLWGSARPRLLGWARDLDRGSWCSERSLSEWERHNLLCLCLLQNKWQMYRQN